MDARSKLLRLNDSVGEVFGTEHFSLFLYGLIRMQRPKTVVELGSGFGVSAFWMALGVQENQFGHVWTVDDGLVFRRKDLVRRVRNAVKKAGLRGIRTGSADAYFSSIQKSLRLREPLTFVERQVKLEEGGHFDDYPFGREPIDLLFSDFGHRPDAVLRLLAHFLPRMSAASSILVHSASTFWPSYLLLEKVTEQLGSGRVPKSLLDRGRSDLREFVRTRKVTLVHLTERKLRAQNGAAWLKIEPVDVVPHPKTLMRG